MQHNITKYTDEVGKRWAVSWLQINLFGKCFCLNQKKIAL